MKIRQLVQVEILGAYRPYTYAWEWDPHEGEKPLAVGDKVELPPNQVQDEGSSGRVVALGSPYDGPVKPIVKKIEERPRPTADNDIWFGFGQGDYA